MKSIKIKRGLATASLGVLALLSATGQAQAGKAKADTVVHSGKIYTGVDKEPWVEAVAIRDGVVVAAGKSGKMLKRAATDATLIDLGGRMAMAGIIDAHSHPVDGAVMKLFECTFPFSATPDEIAAAVTACVAGAGDEPWIAGGQWDSNFFVNNKIASPRKFLDKVSGGKAVGLVDDSGHNAWLNTKALKLVGITAQTPDPAGGRIGREADGKTPNGVLEETAATIASPFLTAHTPEQFAAAVEEMQVMLNGLGITAVKIANMPDEHLEAVALADADGDLRLHVTTSLATHYGARSEKLDVAGLISKRDQYKTANVNTNAVKIFLDGVPTAARTAGMLAPYAPDSHFPDGYLGEMHLTEELLAADMTALDAAGFAVKIHTAGDGSVRRALNAIEVARKANGMGGKQHELAHAGYVDPADIARFKALNVAPDFSPFIWSPSPIIDSVVQAVGPRGEHYWPTKDLIESGAVIVAGSDWPSAVSSPSPWPGIETLVTRRAADGDYDGALWPEEAVSLEDAIEIYTENSATALDVENVTGRIEKGAIADIIVLSQNIFDVDPAKISDTEVVLTLFKGKVVSAKGPFEALTAGK